MTITPEAIAQVYNIAICLLNIWIFLAIGAGVVGSRPRRKKKRSLWVEEE